ncbi:unnamed protein product [Mytilus edulis]|uniref:Uncharacterized protein n=1 Tax=Mytilus edulis TaxID=6550 RepID=A0A8S3UC28_MYTED|nr:unnamed protein product [Mytilus edulis]
MGSEDGETVLHLAAQSGNFELTKWLIEEKGMDPMVKSAKEGKTALHLAAENGRLEITQWLVDEKGMDPMVKTLQEDKTALHLAAEKGQLKVTQWLIEKKEWIQWLKHLRIYMDSKLKSVRAGHKGAVTKLLVKFDELKSKTDTEVDEVKALDDAVTQKQKTLIDLNNRLLEQTSEENLEQEITDSDEYMYELDCKIRQIRKFIKSFEHVETNTIISHDTVGPSTSRLNPDAYHFTPEARVDMNRCAIDSMNQQYSINAPAEGKTALHLAAENGKMEEGKTALHLAAENGEMEVTEWLIEKKGMDPMVKTSQVTFDIIYIELSDMFNSELLT